MQQSVKQQQMSQQLYLSQQQQQPTQKLQIDDLSMQRTAKHVQFQEHKLQGSKNLTQTFQQQPNFVQNITNYQPQPINASAQFMKTQPLAMKTPTISARKRVSFQETVEEPKLVDLRGSKFEMKTPNINEKPVLNLQMQQIIEQTYLLSNEVNWLETVNTLKILTLGLKQEKRFNNFAVESQINQLIKHLGVVFKMYFNAGSLVQRHPYADKLMKYYCLVMNELFNSQLADQEILLRQVIEDLVLGSIVCADPMVKGLIGGTLLNILNKTTPQRQFCAVVQILSNVILQLKCRQPNQTLLSAVLQSEFAQLQAALKTILQTVFGEMLKDFKSDVQLRLKEAWDIWNNSDLKHMTDVKENWLLIEQRFPDFCAQLSLN